MEVYKLFTRKKLMLFLLVIYLVTLVLLWQDKPNNKDYDDNYIDNYQSSIAEVISSSDDLSSFSIFTEEDSYSQRNIEKTKEDFIKISDIEVQEPSGKYLEKYFAFDKINISIFIAGIILAIALLDEKKKSLQCVIHTCVKGRASLVIKRLLTLSGAIAVYGFVIKMSALFEALILSGGSLLRDWSLPIQSIQKYCMLTYRFSLGQFLLIEALYTILSCTLVALMVWTCYWIIDNNLLASGVVVLVGAVEFFFYMFIKPGQGVESLHYCNIFYNCIDRGTWSEYKNINVFSMPVDKIKVNLLIQAVFIIIILVSLLILAHYRYPIKGGHYRVQKILNRLSNGYSNCIGAIQERMSIVGAEIYKAMISQKGIAIICLVIVMILYFNPMRSVHFMGYQKTYNSFMEEYGGEPTRESDQKLQELEKEVSDEDARHESVLLKFEQGTVNEEEVFKSQMIHDNMEYKRELLYTLQDQKEHLANIKKERNIKGWYVNSFEYRALLEDEKFLNIVLLMVGISLMAAAGVNSEKKTNMGKIIHTSIVGRRKMIAHKIIVAIASSLPLYWIMVIIRLLSVNKTFGLEGLEAPVQSYYFLADIGPSISMREYLILRYVVRTVIVMCWICCIVLINLSMDSKLACIVTVICGLMGWVIAPKVGYNLIVCILIPVTVCAIILQQRKWKKCYEISN